MNFDDILAAAVHSLGERKFRLALNVLGILIGCAAVTGLVSVTQGLTDEVATQLEMFGPNNIMVIPFEIRPGAGLVGNSFNWRDIQVMEKVSHIKYLTPIIGNKIAWYNLRGERYRATVFGVEPIYFKIFQTYEVEEGRALLRADKGAVVIGHLIAQPRGEDEPLIEVGDRIKFTVTVAGEDKEEVFRVVGIMKEIGGTFGSEDDQSVMIPFREAQQLYEVGSSVDFVSIMVDHVDNVDLVREEIEDKFDDNVMVMSFDLIKEQVGSVLGTIEAVLGGIAAISLLVAGVGIVNTMTISVMERTREIGVLKAIGGKKTDILYMFLSEATITGFLGGVLGAAFGFAMGKFVGDYIGLPVSTSIDLGAFVVGFAIVTAVLAGLYPAWRASNMHPVDALRYE
ncbi:MAG: ABC transporter permease [Candidatus Bathyarchaeota archaeon]|nr:ABC transporter permease [Candidatus Bathyarchaeota archaeon]